MARKSQPDWDSKELGQALRVLRHRAGLRQSDVASRASSSGRQLSQIHYRKCESGQSLPTYEMLDTIVQSLGSTPEELNALMSDPLTLEQGRYLAESNYRNRSLDTDTPVYQTVTRALVPQNDWDASGMRMRSIAKFDSSVGFDQHTLEASHKIGGMSVGQLSSAAPASSLTASADLSAAMALNAAAAPVSDPQVEAEITRHAGLYRQMSRGSQLALDSLYQHYAKNDQIS